MSDQLVPVLFETLKTHVERYFATLTAEYTWPLVAAHMDAKNRMWRAVPRLADWYSPAQLVGNAWPLKALPAIPLVELTVAFSRLGAYGSHTPLKGDTPYTAVAAVQADVFDPLEAQNELARIWPLLAACPEIEVNATYTITYRNILNPALQRTHLIVKLVCRSMDGSSGNLNTHLLAQSPPRLALSPRPSKR